MLQKLYEWFHLFTTCAAVFVSCIRQWLRDDATQDMCLWLACCPRFRSEPGLDDRPDGDLTFPVLDLETRGGPKTEKAVKSLKLSGFLRLTGPESKSTL